MPLKQIYTFFLLLISITCYSQEFIEITGTIKDASNKQPLPFANVSFLKNEVSCTTDSLGYFAIKIQQPCIVNDIITASYVGYQTNTISVKINRKRNISIKLEPQGIDMKGIVFTSKREKYSNKNNPAVELIERVIANKHKNILEVNDYYQYDKHEILLSGINNFSDTLKVLNRMLRFFDFSTKYIALSELNDKYVLPVYINENLYSCYYRKSPEASKTYLKTNKTIEVHRMVDMQGLESTIKQVFSDINIYNNAIPIFGNEFMGPLSPLSTSFYKFFIVDTCLLGNDSCINLMFLPRNASDFGFSGNLFIIKDTNSLAVKKTTLRLLPKSGINWVSDLFIEQEFELIDSNWCLVKDEAMADMKYYTENLFSAHIRRSNTYKNYRFHQAAPDSVYKHTNEITKSADYDKSAADSNFRLRDLYLIEGNTYLLYDELKRSFKFKFFSNAMMALATGYIPSGKFDVGPWDALVSYNDIEGIRFRFGGRTNTLFNNRLFANGYIAYGLHDEEFKYQAGISYSFNKRKFFMREYPRNLISLTYQHDNKIPGNPIAFGNSYDKILRSFRSQPLTKMTSDKMWGIQYEKDMKNGLSIDFSFINMYEKALGEMNFNTATSEKNSFVNSQFSLKLRYVQSEKFYQVNEERFGINNSKPTFSLKYDLGVQDLLNSDFTFHKLELGISKRTFLSGFGYADLRVDCGKIWNPIPYPMLFIPQGNQSYFEINTAYNLMNIMEFISDQYISASLSYYSPGLLFNRIPIIKKLNLREAIAVKAIWGSLNSQNLPQNNPDLMLFPTSSSGQPTLFLFNNVPYIEAAFGIYNIFNVLKIDFIKRFTYLENKGAIKWGVRLAFKFGF